MSEELRDSPFLGDRLINFTQEIVTHRGLSRFSPVSDFEVKLAKNVDKILELDQRLSNQLVKILKESKNAVPTHVALRALLFAQSRNLVPNVRSFLTYAERSQQAYSDEEVSAILKEMQADPAMPVDWLMAMYAKDRDKPTDSEHKPLTIKPF